MALHTHNTVQLSIQDNNNNQIGSINKIAKFENERHCTNNTVQLSIQDNNYNKDGFTKQPTSILTSVSENTTL